MKIVHDFLAHKKTKLLYWGNSEQSEPFFDYYIDIIEADQTKKNSCTRFDKILTRTIYD